MKGMILGIYSVTCNVTKEIDFSTEFMYNR